MLSALLHSLYTTLPFSHFSMLPIFAIGVAITSVVGLKLLCQYTGCLYSYLQYVAPSLHFGPLGIGIISGWVE